MFQTAGARVRLSGSLFSTRPSKPRTHQCMHMSVSLRWTPIIMERFDFLSIFFFFNGLLLKQHQATTELIRELCTPPLSGSDGSKRRLQRIDGCSYALPSDTEWIKHANFQVTQSTRAKFAKGFFFIQITQRYVHIRVYLQRRMQNRLSCCHEQYSASQALQRQ